MSGRLRSAIPLAMLLFVLGAAAGTATAGKPVPGAIYAASDRKIGVTMIVDPRGTSAKVKWSTSDVGCTGGILPLLMTVGIKQNGSFYGSLRKLPSWAGTYTAKEFLAEARGQFMANGHAAVVSVRVKADLSSKYSHMLCDGRSLKVQLRGGPGD